MLRTCRYGMTLSCVISEIVDAKTLVIMGLVYIYFINKQNEIMLVRSVRWFHHFLEFRVRLKLLKML